MKLLLFGCVVLLTGCATTPPPQSRSDMILQRYKQAATEHFAARDRWSEALRRGDDKCCRPYDLRPDEGLGEYSDRKMDEWAEKDCLFKGWFDGRSVREAQQIQDQCKRDLEVTRLRKAVEKSLKK